MTQMTRGKLFVVSAPSGAGKTTLIQRVRQELPSLFYSISHTTRQPRTGEVHGKDYFFVTVPEFEALIASGQMLEWAKVHGNFYGTSRPFVMEALDAGKSILLDIDVQGGRKVMAAALPMTSIFIKPPSMAILAQRLRNRGTDSEAVIETRLANAQGEMDAAGDYDHVLVNDRLDESVAALVRIFEKELAP